jgi:hypothetical protein
MKHIISLTQVVCLAVFIMSSAWAANIEYAGCAIDLDYSSRNYDPNNFDSDIDSTANASAGEDIYVSIVAQNVTNLDTYQVELAYDPQRLELIESFEDIPFIGIENLLKKNQGKTVGFQAVERTSGVLNIVNSLVGQNTSEAPEGSGIIAILKFKVLDDSSNNPLTLSNVYYADSNVVKEEIKYLSHATLNYQNESNQAPVAKDDHFTMLANQSINITVLNNDFDPDNDPITIMDSTSPKNGIAIVNDNQTISYTPDENYSGTDAFEYTISDVKGYSSTATCTIEIYSHKLNLSIENHPAVENELTGYNIKLSNPEGKDIKGIYSELSFNADILKIEDVTLDGGLLEDSDYVLQYNSDNEGELILSIYSKSPSYISDSGIIANITFKVIGDCGDTDILAFNMAEMNEIPLESSSETIRVIGRPSISSIDHQYIDEDTSSKPLRFTISDCDGDNLSITTFSDNDTLIPNDNDHIQLEGEESDPRISIQPAANQSGTGTIGIMVTDADGLTAVTSFVVNVAPKSDLPTVEIDSSIEGIVNSDISLNIQASLSDSDGSETLSVTISDLPENAILTKGEVNDDGSWVLSGEDLEDLQLQLPDSYMGIFTLTVAVTATETQNNDQQTIVKTIEITCSGLIVSGRINYYAHNTPVKNAIMQLSGAKTYTTLTNDAGDYSIVNVVPGDYDLMPLKTDDLEGLSNTDAGYVGLHVIKKHQLNCMQQIAADVTQNGSIRPLDASNLSIAATAGNGIDCVNDQCVSWVFSTERIEQCNDLSYTAKRVYIGLDESKENQNFTAIRLGDVNGSWKKDK